MLATDRAAHASHRAVSWLRLRGRVAAAPRVRDAAPPRPSALPPAHVTGRPRTVSPCRRGRLLLLQWQLQGGQPQELQHRRHRGQVPAAHGHLRDRHRVHRGPGAHQPGPERHGACAPGSGCRGGGLRASGALLWPRWASAVARLLICWFDRSFIHSFIHPDCNASALSLTYSFLPSLTLSLVPSFIHSFIRSCCELPPPPDEWAQQGVLCGSSGAAWGG